MRTLTKEETSKVFQKLQRYVGSNLTRITNLDPPVSFVLNKDRVFIAPDNLIKAAMKFPRKNVMAVGSCLGKFTKTGHFQIKLSALEYLNQFAEHRLWLMPQGEASWLYGGHVVKRHVAKLTENAPDKSGVVIMSQSNLCLGFGTLNIGTVPLRSAQPETIAVFNQADLGGYLRDESRIN